MCPASAPAARPRTREIREIVVRREPRNESLYSPNGGVLLWRTQCADRASERAADARKGVPPAPAGCARGRESSTLLVRIFVQLLAKESLQTDRYADQTSDP